MAHLPWQIRTRFWVPTKFLRQLKKTIIEDIFFLFYHKVVCCVYSYESHRRDDSNEYTQQAIII